MRSSKKPEYSLSKIQQAFSKIDDLIMTQTAMQCQYALGFSDQDVVDTIQFLKASDFYKTMLPKHQNFSASQDVYITFFKGVELYIKFQINTDKKIIVSFKER